MSVIQQLNYDKSQSNETAKVEAEAQLIGEHKKNHFGKEIEKVQLHAPLFKMPNTYRCNKLCRNQGAVNGRNKNAKFFNARRKHLRKTNEQTHIHENTKNSDDFWSFH